MTPGSVLSRPCMTVLITLVITQQSVCMSLWTDVSGTDNEYWMRLCMLRDSLLDDTSK